ncbi:uncharacterized protein LOC110621931 isoform X2 [Manihot esculenta]|uniref:uncharacterized protein LOC110621931 isoform X2 n=1 Tax=Manihot esculenta TaxID=3983 RepID=UPI001CC5A146|nr:uncharacterized protein LOC110621931 isoform X2 [Manihot esculenta]
MASLGFIVIGIAVSVRKTFSRVVKKKSTENYKSALYVTSLLGYKFVDFLWIHEPRRFACGDCECDWCCFPVHLCHTFSHLRSQPRIKSCCSRLGIREPISLGGPIEYDEIKTRKLKEFLQDLGLYESQEEVVSKEKVLARRDQVRSCG